MKRLTCLGVLALFAVLVLAGMSGSARETVEVTDGTLDFDYTISDDSETSYLFSIRFPCSFNELSAMAVPVVTINSTDAGGLTYDIDASVDNSTWESIVSSGVIAGAGSHTKTYSDIADKIDNSSYMLYIEITCNVTTNDVELHFVADDAEIHEDGYPYINSAISETDDDVVEIEGYDEDDDEETWTVTDTGSFPNSDTLFQTTLTDINFTLDYPDGADTQPTTYWTVASVAWGNTWSPTVSYEKEVPFFDEEDDIDGYTIQLHCEEELNDIAYWEFDPDDYDWDLTEDNDDLVITLNGDELEEDDDEDDNSWYWDDGDIIFENLSLEDSEDDDDDDTDNIVEFDWTRPTAVPDEPIPEEPQEQPWYKQEWQGVPVWVLVALLVIVIMIVAVAAKS